MTGRSNAPAYIGRILQPDGSPAGTCFEIAPGVLVTACHVLRQLSLQVGEAAIVEALDGFISPTEAFILAMDESSDVAVLRSSQLFRTPVTAVARPDSVPPFTQLIITGAAEIYDTRGYDWIDATGEWQGVAQRDGQIYLGRLQSKSVMPGMSGAPVRRVFDDAVIGLVSARYNSQDGWMRDSVWVAPIEHILQLLSQTLQPSELRSLDIREDSLDRESIPATEFAAKVEDSLRTAGYEVTADERVDGKAFDLVGRTTRWRRRWLTGVICLTGRQSLSEQDLKVLWLDFEAPIGSGAINELLVVTEVPPSLQAANWAETNTRVVMQTLASLTGGGLDATGYLRTAAQLFDESPDGLAHYYIPPVTRDGIDLEDEILKWIDNDPKSGIALDQPLAILGSYGLGKTSFAIKLTSILAARAARDDFARIPVLIRLGDIASEQSLEGLIGAHFTAANPVPGYSFPLLQDLNRQGRLVVIFDGFDEMKHLLSWAEFKFNLNQINRMVDGESKVILLGRPTAFENDEEQSEALHGQITGPLTTTSVPNAVDYFELELAPLEAAQVHRYLELYSAYQSSVSERPFDVEKIWRQIQSPQLRDISRRPVQLRMLVEILPDHRGKIEDLDLVTLYDTFVDQIIHQVMLREEDKKNRLAFDRRTRRDFLARLAFWMWELRGTGILTSDQIPDELVARYASGREINRTRRDLVIASPLDRRYGERIRFAHRSFQEFLVAEECLRRLKSHEMTIQQYDGLATDEVANFVKLLRGDGDVEFVSGILKELTGSVAWRTADSLLAAPNVIQNLEVALRGRSHSAEKPMMPWEILLPFLPVISIGAETLVRPHDLTAQARISDEGASDVALLCLFLACSLRAKGYPAIKDILRLLLRGDHGPREMVEADEFAPRRDRRRADDARRENPTSRSRSAVRAAEERQFADDRIPFIPLNRGFVGDARAGYTRIGRYLSRAQLIQTHKSMTRGSLAVNGGTRVEIRWVPDQVVKIAEAMRGSGTDIDMRSLGPVFASHLPEVAFIRDWTGPAGLRSQVKLPAGLIIDAAMGREAFDLRRAGSEYREKLGQLPHREIRPPTEL
ncbi:MAG TPA: NACHT domain-containing protein [Streptosporangiaceae bacterium]|nr:NACHT domain-containing protein [Streptosporangiaceae bacterium]